ncbi:hypothetical protein ACFVIX_16590 [Bacillus subtilis]|uniref:hypothetical protein n=1 Tax=Bacillus subtilis TaxID=1423 RepID=UPI0013CE811B|nr:hypothetical protein [Bacillus subtilis]MDP8525490.1 hypothetical protein [Bacillus subtilis]MEC0417050.1 hypothetical protein [Bacillus subtilis]MEC3693570.1 hypothetical protein [Bacillus subtilis]
MTKEKAIELAAFFAEFEQKMRKLNKLKIADFSHNQMLKYCRAYLVAGPTE